MHNLPVYQLASPRRALLLDASTIARIAGGRWRNLPADTQFTGVSFHRRNMAQGATGNLYFALDPRPEDASFQEDTLDDARKAFQDGAAAVVVAGAVQDLPLEWPLLLVDNVVEALDRLAFEVRDHLFMGKRVLVSGTYGSNLFKNMLQQVLSPQMTTHAFTALLCMTLLESILLSLHLGQIGSATLDSWVSPQPAHLDPSMASRLVANFRPSGRPAFSLRPAVEIRKIA